jgi:hypothetical protein
VSLRDANTLLIGVFWFLRTRSKADGKYRQKAKVSELHGAFSDWCSFSACRTHAVNLYCLQIPRFRVAAGDRPRAAPQRNGLSEGGTLRPL